MPTYVMLLRGINVGGRNGLPMKELAALLGELDCKSVKTYNQSGNVVFQCTTKAASALGGKIGALVNQHRGFKPHALVLGLADVERALAANPFPEAESNPT